MQRRESSFEFYLARQIVWWQGNVKSSEYMLWTLTASGKDLNLLCSLNEQHHFASVWYAVSTDQQRSVAGKYLQHFTSKDCLLRLSFYKDCPKTTLHWFVSHWFWSRHPTTMAFCQDLTPFDWSPTNLESNWIKANYALLWQPMIQ